MAKKSKGGKKLSQQIREFTARTDVKIDAAVRSIATAVLSDLVYLSPVGDPGRWSGPAPEGYVGGHFRGNWQVTLNSPAGGEVAGTDASGAATIGAGKSVIDSARRSDRIFMVNNVPYARRLEYGWSDQAPQGVVRITVAKFQATMRAAVGGGVT